MSIYEKIEKSMIKAINEGMSDEQIIRGMSAAYQFSESLMYKALTLAKEQVRKESTEQNQQVIQEKESLVTMKWTEMNNVGQVFVESNGMTFIAVMPSRYDGGFLIEVEIQLFGGAYTKTVKIADGSSYRSNLERIKKMAEEEFKKIVEIANSVIKGE